MQHSLSIFSNPVIRGVFITTLGACSLGFAAIGLRVSEMEPTATGFWRMALAVPILAIFAFARGIPIKRPGIIPIITGVIFGSYLAFWHDSLLKTSVANATFIVNIGAVCSGLIAWVLFKEKPAKLWPLAAIITLVGATIMSLAGANGGSGSLEGDLVATIAGAMSAFYLVFVSKSRKSFDAVNVIFWVSTFAALSLAVFSKMSGEAIMPSQLSHLAVPLFLAIFIQLLGQGFIILGSGSIPPSLIGLIVMLQPVVSGAIAWVYFEEALSGLQLVGTVFIIFGVVMAGHIANQMRQIAGST
jgi:drug/metabolite transporter (DMT)-like permease